MHLLDVYSISDIVLSDLEASLSLLNCLDKLVKIFFFWIKNIEIIVDVRIPACINENPQFVFSTYWST